MQNQTVTQIKSLDAIKDLIRQCKSLNDPEIVLKEAEKDLVNNEPRRMTELDSNIFKSLTLLEFENGTLMTTAIPDVYKTFGIDLLRKMQDEYNCQTVSEKATTELAVINYIRTLEIERRITSYLSLPTISDMGIKFLSILSKELDRANRHYLTAIQTLRMMKQVPLNVTIKAQTAIVGQNQLVQTNNSHE